MNLRPFLETLSVKNTKQQVVPLVPNWAQLAVVSEVERAYHEERPCRLIILKARQLGISTISEAILFTKATIEPNTNAVIVAHDSSSSEVLFNMTKFYYESWPYKKFFPHKYATRRQLSIEATGSNIWVMTAEHTEAGRGRTIHAAHFSEVGFWTEPTDAMLAFNQAIHATPGTLAIIESTANGVGNWFHSQWVMAEAGETDYVPLFFPWWGHYEYIPCQGLGCLDGSCERCEAESKGIKAIDDDERHLVKMGCDAPHLAWRRWAIPNKTFGNIDLFHQEYPSYPDEAFITSGVNVFPEPYLRQVFEPIDRIGVGRLEQDSSMIGAVRFVPDARGPLRIYRQPSSDPRWGDYFIGADPCFGSVDGDYAAAHVINRHNREQVAVWHGRMNPISFADELAKLGRYYNDAKISVEVEGPGYGTIGRLSAIYGNLWRHRFPDKWPHRQISNVSIGFSATYKRKQWAINKLSQFIEQQEIILHDQRTFEELRNYTFMGERGFGEMYGPASSEMHDDLVMALAVTMLCNDGEEPPENYNAPPKTPSGIIWGERMDDEQVLEELMGQ